MTDQQVSQPATKPRGINWKRVNWAVAIGIAAMHVGALFAPFFFSWSGLALAVIFYWMSGGLGITLCYHRLLTHRSFKSPKWFEYFLTTCACLAWQGGPIQWVGMHRLHHKLSDLEGDPHSPRDGFGWSHMFWCLHQDPEHLDPKGAAKDLQRDKVISLLDRFFWVPQFVVLIGAFVGGELAARYAGFQTSGLSWVLWGVCVRTVFLYHSTWLVNSASHTWGYRNFETTDQSTNNWWVALLSFGEGWHNNHHAQQRSAAHGMRWYEFDLTWLTIRVLSWVGLARDVVKPELPEDFKERKAAQHRAHEATESLASKIPPVGETARQM